MTAKEEMVQNALLEAEVDHVLAWLNLCTDAFIKMRLLRQRPFSGFGIWLRSHAANDWDATMRTRWNVLFERAIVTFNKTFVQFM